MRVFPLLALLAACDDGDPDIVPGDTSGVPVCGRLEGSTAILIYEDDGATIRSPEESPDDSTVATGVAGPVGGEYGYLAVEDGRVLRSEDGGCSWGHVGNLPASGDWALLAAGDRVYAFDRASADGARTDDLGGSWSTFSVGGVPLGLPTVADDDPQRLRAVTAEGVWTSTDGGDAWSASGALPAEAGTVTAAAVGASDLDVVVLGAATGVWLSRNAGASWEARSTTGAATSVAVHPDDASVLFAQFPEEDGTVALWRSADAGADWTRLVDETQITMGAAMPLWPLPGATGSVVTAYGPVENNDGEPSLALYVSAEGEGTHTTRVTLYFHLHQLAFGADRWVAAVDSVP